MRRRLFVIIFWIFIIAIGVGSFSLIRHWLGWDIPQDIVDRRKAGWTVLTMEPDSDGKLPAFALTQTMVAGKQAGRQIWGESDIHASTHFTCQVNGNMVISMSRRFVRTKKFVDSRGIVDRMKHYITYGIPIIVQAPPHWGGDTWISLPAGSQATILASPDGTIPFGKPTPIIRYSQPGVPDAIIEITTSHEHPTQ